MFEKKTECTQVGTTDDGSKQFVCKTGDGNVYNATVGLDGNIRIDKNFVTTPPKVYQEIHETLHKISSPV